MSAGGLAWWICPTMYNCRSQLRLPFRQASDESVASVVAWTLIKISKTGICRSAANKSGISLRLLRLQ
ncbi:acidic mammalian chitinase, partial [Biomphalaria glabrata]